MLSRPPDSPAALRPSETARHSDSTACQRGTAERGTRDVDDHPAGTRIDTLPSGWI